jgi:hypothetical protein
VRFYDIAGIRFSRLVALSYGPHPKNSLRNAWKCKCECGKTIYSESHALRFQRIKSCGCLRREQTIKRSTKHGHRKKAHTTSEYYLWRNLKTRGETRLDFPSFLESLNDIAPAQQPLPTSEFLEIQVSA